MGVLVVGIAGLIVAGLLYLLFIFLFLVRLLGNRTLWSLAMHFMRPVLREFYSYDLAEAANRVLQAQPDAIHLKALDTPPWKDKAGAEELRRSLEDLGFSAAGAYGIDIMPGVPLLFMVNEAEAAAACIMEHPATGVWLDVFSAYPGGRGVTVSSGRDPGLPARMRRPGDIMEYRPGADASALYNRLLALRGPEKPVTLTAGNIAARFEEVWAEAMDWRKQHEFTPEEALALKKGRALPPETVKTKKLFDIVGGGLAILNFFALVFFLFAARGYTPVGDGPWLEALRWFGLPTALFALTFAVSMQATGPVMRLVGGVFMAIIAAPFFWGTFYMGGTWYNGAQDTAAAVVHRAEITDKYTSRGRDKDHYAVVKSWRAGRASEKLHLTQEQYLKAGGAGSVILIATRPGALGHEWIAGLDFENPPPR